MKTTDLLTTWTRAKSRGGFALTCVALCAHAWLADPAQAAPPPTAAEIASAFGFGDDQLQKMLEGEIEDGKLEANSDNELALSMGFISPRDVDWHWERLKLRTTVSDPSVGAIGDFSAGGKASLDALTLPDDELDRLAEIEPGEDANFSTVEIDKFQQAAGAHDTADKRRAAVLSALREILAARFAAYERSGLAGIAAYAREDGEESQPAKQLERAFEALNATRRVAPDVYATMSGFPTAVPEGVQSFFTWIVHEAQGRPVVALAHTVIGRNEGNVAAIQRRFFVSHTLNSLQIVVIALPNETGSVLFYANRTGTDQITGFGSSVAKGIGRKIMQGELEALVKAFLSANDREK